MKEALETSAATKAAFSVPLLRVAQFLRQVNPPLLQVLLPGMHLFQALATLVFPDCLLKKNTVCMITIALHITSPFEAPSSSTIQAGLVPRVLSRLVADLYIEATEALRRVPAYELVPWWWKRDRSKPLAALPDGIGAFRSCPESIDVLQLPVLMALLNEYDIQGIPLPKSRKIYEANLAPESVQGCCHASIGCLGLVLPFIELCYRAPLIHHED